MRFTHHIVVLGLLGAMTLSGLGARWGESSAPVALAAPSPAPLVNAQAPAVVTSMATAGGSNGGALASPTSPTPAAGASAPVAAAPPAGGVAGGAGRAAPPVGRELPPHRVVRRAERRRQEPGQGHPVLDV